MLRAGQSTWLAWLALLAAALNLLPLLLVSPEGDSVMNYAQIDCFSKQLWSGIVYPRWCMDANGGMGSPAPIFYFPLPFYVAALFHPLGLAVPQQYLAGVFVANAVAFAGCVRWLGGRVRFPIAAFAAFVFLWSGYRAELHTRSSYAEYCCVALLPLLFYYLRQLCEQPWRHWPKLALVITLCMFCHAPVTLIGLMGAGLFVLFFSRTRMKSLLELGIACALAAMIGLFHYLPMKLLEPTLNQRMGGPAHWQLSWVNSYLNQPQVYRDHQWALIGLGISLLAAITIFALFLFKRGTITDTDARRECMGWLAIAAIAGFMTLSVSEPLWWVVRQVSGVTTPWRMPSLIALAMVLIGAVMAEHVWRHRKTAQGDALIALMFFVFSGLFYYGGVSQDTRGNHEKAIADQYIIRYFNTKDTDTKYGTDKQHFYHDFIDRPGRRQAEWVAGSGALNVAQWNAAGIIVSGHADKAGTLRLEHFYYPIWQATLNKAPLAITVEPISGRMLLNIPKGDFILRLGMDYWGMVFNPAAPKAVAGAR